MEQASENQQGGLASILRHTNLGVLLSVIMRRADIILRSNSGIQGKGQTTGEDAENESFWKEEGVGIQWMDWVKRNLPSGSPVSRLDCCPAVGQ